MTELPNLVDLVSPDVGETPYKVTKMRHDSDRRGGTFLNSKTYNKLQRTLSPEETFLKNRIIRQPVTYDEKFWVALEEDMSEEHNTNSLLLEKVIPEPLWEEKEPSLVKKKFDLDTEVMDDTEGLVVRSAGNADPQYFRRTHDHTLQWVMSGVRTRVYEDR
tara:strand:+ start:881 stop:1363 length:483 start_codon:yes stop_codon:yes gene_type:complete